MFLALSLNATVYYWFLAAPFDMSLFAVAATSNIFTFYLSSRMTFMKNVSIAEVLLKKSGEQLRLQNFNG